MPKSCMALSCHDVTDIKTHQSVPLAEKTVKMPSSMRKLMQDAHAIVKGSHLQVFTYAKMPNPRVRVMSYQVICHQCINHDLFHAIIQGGYVHKQRHRTLALSVAWWLHYSSQFNFTLHRSLLVYTTLFLLLRNWLYLRNSVTLCCVPLYSVLYIVANLFCFAYNL